MPSALLRSQVWRGEWCGLNGATPLTTPFSMWRSFIPVVFARISRVPFGVSFLDPSLHTPYPANTPSIHSHAAGACGEATPPMRSIALIWSVLQGIGGDSVESLYFDGFD